MSRLLFLSTLVLTAVPAFASADPAPLTDPELARVTGKFMLPNGASIAMSVTSDTLVNGQLVLRSVLTVDQAASLKVYAGGDGMAAAPSRPAVAAAPVPSSVTVLFDRQSGMRTVTPNFAAAPTIAVGTGGAAAAAGAGLTALPLAPGGPAVATSAGLVSLAPSGASVMLSGDRIDVTHLMGPAIATAVANSANDRTIDTVTSIDIDLARVTPFAINSAALRAADLGMDATRGMVR